MRHNRGLTLIEVLIALVIISIALTAVIKATSQNIKNTLYLQNKTIANWVGLRVINEATVGIITLPKAPDHLMHDTEMLNSAWRWDAMLSTTPNPPIQKITVDVFQKPEDTLRAHLVSYLYVE